MNNNVTEWALTLHNNDFLNRIMFFFSKIGKGGFVFWIIVLIYSAYFFFKKKDKKLTLLTLGYFISLGIAFVLVDYVIKPIVKESRPFVRYPEILTFFEKYCLRYKNPAFYAILMPKVGKYAEMR